MLLMSITSGHRASVIEGGKGEGDVDVFRKQHLGRMSTDLF